MRVAGVSYHWNANEIGGAQVPAVSFVEFSKVLGHEASILGFTHRGIPHKNYVSKTFGVDMEIFKKSEAVDVLNNYDFVFFCLPYPMKADPEEYIDLYKNLKSKFTVMTHSEYDRKVLYPEDVMNRILSLPNCVGVSVIRSHYWEDIYGSYKILPFHPCTLPEYLMKEGSPEYYLGNRSGLLYQARVSSIKGIELMAKLSKETILDEAFEGFTVRGTANLWHVDQKVNDLDPNWDRLYDVYNVYDVRANKEYLSTFKYFWDVFGSNRFTIDMKRLNLAAIEAMSVGVIPVVDINAVPDWVKEVSVVMDRNNVDILHIKDQIDRINSDYKGFLRKMRELLISEEYSYERVKSYVANILGEVR